MMRAPVIWLALLDRKADGTDASAGGVITRTLVFGAITLIGLGVVLAPYWIAFYHNPIKQAPIYHESRANYLLEPHYGLNFFIVPTAAVLLAFPFIFWRGATSRRLRPLFRAIGEVRMERSSNETKLAS